MVISYGLAPISGQMSRRTLLVGAMFITCSARLVQSTFSSCIRFTRVSLSNVSSVVVLQAMVLPY